LDRKTNTPPIIWMQALNPQSLLEKEKKSENASTDTILGIWENYLLRMESGKSKNFTIHLLYWLDWQTEKKVKRIWRGAVEEFVIQNLALNPLISSIFLNKFHICFRKAVPTQDDPNSYLVTIQSSMFFILPDFASIFSKSNRGRIHAGQKSIWLWWWPSGRS